MTIKPATPLLWHSEGQRVEGDGNPAGTVAETVAREQYGAKDAAYIVHACNAYPKLVAALRDLACPHDSPPSFTDSLRSLNKARALLRELGKVAS